MDKEQLKDYQNKYQPNGIYTLDREKYPRVEGSIDMLVKEPLFDTSKLERETIDEILKDARISGAKLVPGGWKKPNPMGFTGMSETRRRRIATGKYWQRIPR